MSPDLHLTSLQNPRVKQVLALRDRKDRDRSQHFLIEGYRELLRATDAGWKVETLFTCADFFLGTNEAALIQRMAKGRLQNLDLLGQGISKVVLSRPPRWPVGDRSATTPRHRAAAAFF